MAKAIVAFWCWLARPCVVTFAATLWLTIPAFYVGELGRLSAPVETRAVQVDADMKREAFTFVKQELHNLTVSELANGRNDN